MKSLDQLDSWITNKVRAWSSRVSGAPQSRELLEIRRDILNDIRDHIQPRGEGKTLFPYNTILIRLTAEDSNHQAVLEQAFSQEDLLQTIGALLAEAACPVPTGLQVSVEVTQDAGSPLRVDYSNAKSAAATAPKPNTRPHAKLTILSGQSDGTEYIIAADRINIGRLKEVVSDKD